MEEVKGQQRKVLVQRAKKRRSKAKRKVGGARKTQLQNKSAPSSAADEAYANEGSPSEDEEGSDTDEEEQEDVKDYCHGGYHVVNIGDLFQGRYHVIRKLGWGHFSTVWLAWDLTDKSFVALKIVKSATHYTETAVDEMKLLRTIHTANPDDEGYPHVVQLLDDFKINGIHGSHVCMVFEVLGHNLLKFIIKSSYQGISIPMAKTIIKQTLSGLNYLHTKCNVIHTDIKPENILVCINQDEIQKLASDAAAASQQGKLSKSLTATAPKHIIQKQTDSSMKMSKNKKKKLKQKIKKQLQKHQQEIDTAPPEDGEGEGEGEEEEESAENNIADFKPADLANSTTANSSNDVVVNMDTNSNSNCNNNESNATTATTTTTTTSSVAGINRDESQSSMDIVKTHPENTQNELSYNTREHPVATPPPDEIDSNGDCRMDSVDRDMKRESKSKSKSKSKSCSPEERSRDRKERLSVDSEEKVLENGVERELAERLKLDCDDSKPARGNTFLDNADISVKIADLGNACWVDHHFTEEIQTRQYRSLEVLLGSGYSTAADLWSTACMAFELVTGDFLFEPHSGENYTRDEDHIALIIELLGPIPRQTALGGKYSKDFFNRKVELKHIKKLKPWNLKRVLMEKYEWSLKDATEFGEFLEPMMHYEPDKRATALECMEHPWLNTP